MLFLACGQHKQCTGVNLEQLERARGAHLLPSLVSVTSVCLLEIGCGGSLYTMGISKRYIEGRAFFSRIAS